MADLLTFNKAHLCFPSCFHQVVKQDINFKSGARVIGMNTAFTFKHMTLRDKSTSSGSAAWQRVQVSKIINLSVNEHNS